MPKNLSSLSSTPRLENPFGDLYTFLKTPQNRVNQHAFVEHPGHPQLQERKRPIYAVVPEAV